MLLKQHTGACYSIHLGLSEPWIADTYLNVITCGTKDSKFVGQTSASVDVAPGMATPISVQKVACGSKRMYKWCAIP